MIEFIKLARKRGVVADVIHAALNIAFAAATIFLTMAFETPWPAMALVLMSKWRVIAVRPRYWWANFLSSLPDLAFGIGIAVISWRAGQIALTNIDNGINMDVSLFGLSLPLAGMVQVVLGLIFAVWLVWIKPKHDDKWVSFQALASQCVGLMAIFTMGLQLSLTGTLILSFVVAFASARQVLGQFEEKDQGFLASVWGLLVMELAFVSWHWSVFYTITPLVYIPQITLITMVISVVAYRVYGAWSNDRRVTWDELGAPAALAIAVTLLVLFGFSGLW